MRNINGKEILLGAAALAGLGGMLWIDHKRSVQEKTANKLAADLEALRRQCGRGPEPSSTTSDARPAPRPTLYLSPGPAMMLGPMAAAAQAQPAAGAQRQARRGPQPDLALAPRTYDSVFQRRGQGLPVAYLRALALWESGMNPQLADGPAWGLMQVMEVVREDFNRRAGTRYPRESLLDPTTNVTIGASTLRLIMRSYATFHPDVPHLQADWRSPQFVALLTIGWTAGFSELAGVGRVARYLTDRGQEVTLRSVHEAAAAAGATPHLADHRKIAWATRVTRQYFAELAEDDRRRAELAERANALGDADDPVIVWHDDPSIEHDDEPAPPDGHHAPTEIEMPVQTYDDHHTPTEIEMPVQTYDGGHAQTYPSGGHGPEDPYAGPVDATAPVELHEGYPAEHPDERYPVEGPHEEPAPVDPYAGPSTNPPDGHRPGGFYA